MAFNQYESRGLLLVGWGLEGGQATLEAIRAVEEAAKVYVESYTVAGSSWIIESLKQIVGEEKLVPAERSIIEEGSPELLAEAGEKLIAIVAPGDPLIATTHRSLLVEAATRGIPYRVIPGVSGVCNAKTMSWLDYYKFGRTATLPGPWRRVRPYSVYQYIISNVCAGLHTLLLLDINPSSNEQLDPCTGLRLLGEVASEIESEAPYEFSLSELPAVVVERAGMRAHRTVLYPSIRGVCEAGIEHGSPSSIVIPGVPAEYEWEALQILSYKPLGSPATLRRLDWREQPRICKYYLWLLENL